MKKTVLFFPLLILSLFTAKAQYQLLNPGFENWEGTSNTAKPAYWSSFPQSDGTWAWAARTAQHYHRNGGRPGTNGTSYLTIFSRSVMGVVANGNMTTGQVHAGSTTPSSTSNYNYTHRNEYAHTFSGTPDSMYVWASFYAADTVAEASIRAVLHGNSDFRDPNDCQTSSLFKGSAVARFHRTTSSNNTPNWIQQRVPFVYDGTSTVNYILMSMTTNAIQGSGHTNDSLSVDDIEFIYSAWLDSIFINGSPIANFNRGNFYYLDSMASVEELANATISYQTQANDAVATMQDTWLSTLCRQFVINVMAEDSVTTRTYTITLTCPAPPCNPIENLAADVEENTVLVSWNPGTNNTYWEVSFGESNAEQSAWTDTICHASALALSNLPYETEFSLIARAYCNDSTYTDWSEPISFTTGDAPAADCLAPISIEATDITTNSCTINFTSPYTDTAVWNEVLILQNDETVTDYLTQNLSEQITNLHPATTYIAMVRTQCDSDNYSGWTVTTFATLADTTPVSINTIDADALRIMPNPVHDMLTVSTSRAFLSVAIFDQAGRKVMEQAFDNKPINIANLPAGIYTILLTDKHGHTTKHFIKSK